MSEVVDIAAIAFGPQCEEDRAAMIAAHDGMSELAKQRALDDALCFSLRQKYEFTVDGASSGPDRHCVAAVERIQALSEQVRDLTHERDGLQARLDRKTD